MFDIGSRIARYRNLRGWTQNDLAEKCNMTREALSRLEHNRSRPNIGTLENLCALFDVSLAEFFGSTELPADLIKIMDKLKLLTPIQREALGRFLDTLV